MAIKVYDWIRHHARRVPHQAACIDLHSGRRFTYAQMDGRVDRAAAFLAGACGIGRGDRVAVLAPNTTDIFEIQFACVRLGAIFVPLNWRLTVPELTYILGDAAPKALVHDESFADAAAALQSACGIAVTVQTGGAGNAYEHGLARAGAPPAPAALVHDDIWTIMYTSGTTGHPKGAIITHGMTFWNAVNLGGPALVDPLTVHLAVLPLFHTGGLNCYANPVFHAGGTVAVMREFDPGRCLALLADRGNGLTHFFAVPAHYLFMSQHPDFAATDLSHLKVCGVGGAPCALSILQAWADKGLPLAQGFGMTETSPAVMVLDAGMALAKAGSVGLPVLHNEVRLVDENGDDVTAPETIGELWVKGPNITPGYWNRPEATAEAITDGWLHTGDAAVRDADGHYRIVDRWKDMYISGGENVYPAEVENVIYQLPAVAEVAVIGVPDPRWGEVGEAVIAVKPGHTLAEADVLRHCRDRLARFKQPKSVRFVAALPRNATGKVLKRELRAAR
jgi:fatty-acyl-CoA synthase